MTLATLIHNKPRDLQSCAPTDFLDEALDRMVGDESRAVLVLEKDKDVVGILTDDDIIRAVQKRNEVGDTITRDHVFDWMSLDPVSADGSTTLKAALSLMSQHKIRHLVVTKSEEPIAIIGVSDVLSALHSKDKDHVKQLRSIIGIPCEDKFSSYFK